MFVEADIVALDFATFKFVGCRAINDLLFPLSHFSGSSKNNSIESF